MSKNLLWREVAPGQNQKETTINEQSSYIDAALTEVTTYAGDGPFVATAKEVAHSMVLSFSGAVVTNYTLTLPVQKSLFIVDNRAATVPLTVIKGSTSIEVPLGVALAFYSDDTTDGLSTLTNYTVAPNTIDYHGYKPGLPTANEIVLAFAVNKASSIRANMSGSKARLTTAPSDGAYNLDVQKNGSSIGTITFGLGSTTATFTTTGGVSQSLASGDNLTIVAPGTPDAAAAGLSVGILSDIL